MFQWQIDLEHYLRTLANKPGALHGSVALQQAPPEIKTLYEQFFRSNARGFIDILQYCQNKNIPHLKLVKTIHELNRLCPKDVSPDKVLALLGNQPSENVPVAPSERMDEIEICSREQLMEITQMVNNAFGFERRLVWTANVPDGQRMRALAYTCLRSFFFSLSRVNHLLNGIIMIEQYNE